MENVIRIRAEVIRDSKSVVLSETVSLYDLKLDSTKNERYQIETALIFALANLRKR